MTKAELNEMQNKVIDANKYVYAIDKTIECIVKINRYDIKSDCSLNIFEALGSLERFKDFSDMLMQDRQELKDFIIGILNRRKEQLQKEFDDL